MRIGASAPVRRDGDMLPVLNVVLLLLVFFLMLAQFGEASAPAPEGGPESRHARVAHEDGAALALGRDGRLRDAGLPLDDAALGAWLDAQPLRRQRIRLRADAQVSASRVVDVLQRLEAQGVRQVQLAAVRGP